MILAKILANLPILNLSVSVQKRSLCLLITLIGTSIV